MKIAVYTDGKPPAAAALRFAAVLCRRLSAEMSVLTARPGTHAMESPPPLGVALPREQWSTLPAGMRILTAALEVLADPGFLAPPAAMKIREVPSGYLFVASTSAGQKIPFFEHHFQGVNAAGVKDVDVVHADEEVRHAGMALQAPEQVLLHECGGTEKDRALNPDDVHLATDLSMDGRDHLTRPEIRNI